MTKAEFIRRVQACERRLYRVARTMLSSEADCEDAVQEALIRAWSKLHTLREEAYFETWLIRILINQTKSFYRRRPPAPVELSEGIPGPDTPDTPVMDAICDLPGKTRIAVELHYIEGYSIKECARMLNAPEGTVKWRLKQGRDQLRHIIGEEAAQ